MSINQHLSALFSMSSTTLSRSPPQYPQHCTAVPTPSQIITPCFYSPPFCSNDMQTFTQCRRPYITPTLSPYIQNPHRIPGVLSHRDTSVFCSTLIMILYKRFRDIKTSTSFKLYDSSPTALELSSLYILTLLRSHQTASSPINLPFYFSINNPRRRDA